MKRRTLLVLVVVLSMLMIPVPVRASTMVGNHPSNAQKITSDNHSLSADLADILNALPEGHHDNFAGVQSPFLCRAEGWAADPDDRVVDLNIRIFSDGVEIAQTVADTFRQDLADAGVCQEGTCSFSVNLWGLITPNVDHVILVQAQDAQTGEWSNIYDTPKTLNCSEQNFLPVGYHDAWEGTQSYFYCLAEGWVIDPNDPTLDLTVKILSDGVEVAQVLAGDYRPDLEQGNACPEGTCSFKVDLATLISPNIDHSIMIQAQDAQTGEWVTLNNSPKTLNCINPGAQPIIPYGFGNPGNFAVEALEVFDDNLYAEATNYSEGATIWRSADSAAWTQVTSPGFDSAYSANNPIVFDMVTFKD